MFTYKSLSENLDNNECVYVLTVEDVQVLAEQKLGRKLNFEEMYQVRKGIEWGMFDWETIVDSAIDELGTIKNNK